MKSRIKFIDIAKCIAILMIVDVHLQSGALFPLGETFHVAAFFVISGIISGFKDNFANEGLKCFGVKKCRSLLYPYATLSIAYILFTLASSFVLAPNEILARTVKSILKSVTLQGNGTLWFLPVLFIGELLFFALARIFKKKGAFSSLILLGIGVFGGAALEGIGIVGREAYGVDNLKQIFISGPVTILLSSFIAAGFIGVGYLLSKPIKSLSVHNLKNAVILGVILIVSFIADRLLIGFYTADIHKMAIGNPFVYLLCTLAGCTLCLSLALLLDFIPKASNVLGFYGKNSIIIMTTHLEYYINYAVFLLLSRLNILNLNGKGILFGVLSLALIIAVETVIILIVNKTPLRLLYKFPVRKEIKND